MKFCKELLIIELAKKTVWITIYLLRLISLIN